MIRWFWNKNLYNKAGTLSEESNVQAAAHSEFDLRTAMTLLAPGSMFFLFLKNSCFYCGETSTLNSFELQLPFRSKPKEFAPIRGISVPWPHQLALEAGRRRHHRRRAAIMLLPPPRRLLLPMKNLKFKLQHQLKMFKLSLPQT